MTRGVQVVMSTRINSVLDALMSALIAVDIDTTWRFFTEFWVVVMDTTAIQEKVLWLFCRTDSAEQKHKPPLPFLRPSPQNEPKTLFFQRAQA